MQPVNPDSRPQAPTHPPVLAPTPTAAVTSAAVAPPSVKAPAPTPVPAGGALVLELPVGATRSLASYSLAALTGTAPSDIASTTSGVTP